MHCLYAPVGLDIGSDTPEAIALSIIAEIQAVVTNRLGGSLKDRNGTIHAQIQEQDIQLKFDRQYISG